MTAMDLAGKAIVITGAGRGIGAALAHAAAAAGARVILNDVDGTEVETVAAAIRAAGGEAAAHPADIASWDAAGGLIERCVDSFGTIDGLVNNAGLLRIARIDETTESLLREVVAANIFGTAHCAIHAARHMMGKGRGSIVNVTSGAQSGMESMSVYGATKAAAAAFTYAWAIELAASNVRVNAVSPLAASRMGGLRADQGLQPVHASRPDPGAMAPLFLYLLSDASHGVTGQVVRFDGRRLSLMTHPAILLPAYEKEVWTRAEIEAVFQTDLRHRQLPAGVASTTGSFEIQPSRPKEAAS